MSAAAPQPKDNQGQPVPRIDARLKVTGEALYSADIPLNNVAHGVLVTSDIARGQVRSIHLDAARRTPGVLDVLSYDDMGDVKPPRFGHGSYTSLAPLHERTIRHDGQIMALIVAETLEAAQEAADKVTADYQVEQPSAGLDSPGTETIPAVGNTQRLKENPSVGDFKAAFAAAPVQFEAEYPNAYPDPQPDGAVLDDGDVDGQTTDGVRADPESIRNAGRDRAPASDGCRRRPGDRAVCGRRLRF